MSLLRWSLLAFTWSFAAESLVADNILSVTAKTDCNGGGLAFTSILQVAGTAWSQTSSYSNASITIVTSSVLTPGFGSDGTPITAYLTNQTGIGTAAAVNEIANGTFVISSRTSPQTIFQGLNLGPGDYYLTLWPSKTLAFAGEWCFASPAIVSAANGVIRKGDFVSSLVPAYPPAATMMSASTNAEISITGTPVPTQTGTITIDSNLPGATFSLSPPVAGAPSGGPYPVTISNAPVGRYGASFNPVPGYVTPAVPPLQTLMVGSRISFNGQYAVSPPPSNILTIAGNCGSGIVLDNLTIYATSWAQTSSYYNVSIAIPTNSSLGAAAPISAFLTTIGGGDIANTSFAIPAGSSANTPTTIFSGLRLLEAGSYQLTVHAQSSGIAGSWCTAAPSTTATVTSVPGVVSLGDLVSTSGITCPEPPRCVTPNGSGAQISIMGVPGTPPPPTQTGTITINSNVPTATFSLSPPVAGASSGGPYPVTINSAPAGLYSITFNAVQGYTAPSVPSQTLQAGGAISFNGQYIVAPPPVSVTLFDAAQLTQSSSLNPQATFAYTDSQGVSHGYNAFAVQASGASDTNGNIVPFNNIGFQFAVQSDGSGSAMVLTVPSGGDRSCHCAVGTQVAGINPLSGGTAQLLIPFGLTVNKIEGINADFGSWPSPVTQAFNCALRVGVDATMGYAFGILYTGFQLGECFGGLFSQPSCNIVYPILNDQSAPCIADPANNSLFGDKSLNTHQIRTIRWKPSGDGLTLSGIKFHLNQTPAQVIGMIQQNGITLYVTTPLGDFWLDNFR